MGVAFEIWRKLRDLNGLKTDMLLFLLNSVSSVQCGFSSPAESSFTPESCSLLLLRSSSLSLEEFELRTEDRTLQLSSVRLHRRSLEEK
ncbi:hypothetical protein AMELA_G00108890 [Ameiurus melas]|uniref:Uncharacterized protein n=1 Tax=Ameiurus melas TaxID=219545 RepID=A0A7J6ARN5_AMEME|nr:hypothetical protein AMELA_G00108890 [Ameiurus melas]